MITGGTACRESPMPVLNRIERSPGPGPQMRSSSSSASLRWASLDASATRFFGTSLAHWPLPQVYELSRRSLEHPSSLRRSLTTEIPGVSPASSFVARVANSFQVEPSACSSSTEHAYGLPQSGSVIPAIFLPSGSRYMIFPFSSRTSDSSIGSMAATRNRLLAASRQMVRTSPWPSGSAATCLRLAGVCSIPAWKMLLPLTNRTAPGFDSHNTSEGASATSMNTSVRLAAADQIIHAVLPFRDWKNESWAPVSPAKAPAVYKPAKISRTSAISRDTENLPSDDLHAPGIPEESRRHQGRHLAMPTDAEKFPPRLRQPSRRYRRAWHGCVHAAPLR